MNTTTSFSSSYQQARQKFREAASACGGEIESIAHPETDLDGSALYVDVARFGPLAAEKVLVLISGTHGVEGYCGSGAQVDLLRRGEVASLPENTGVLMIHAINPFGFAWTRRTTHENIDLNRNWIDFDAPLPANSAYAALSDHIVPADWTEASHDAGSAAFEEYARREGEDALRRAFTGGQYDDPDGVFYGGTQPAWSRLTQERILRHYLTHARAIAIIDYHTGLGPRFGEQLLTCAPDSKQFRRAAQWFGVAVKSTVDGSSVSTVVRGDGLTAAATLFPNREVTAIALEFGTKPFPQMFDALRADAWLHARGKLDSPQGKEIKKGLRAAFYDDADDWKGMIAGQSLLVFRQAIKGLAES